MKKDKKETEKYVSLLNIIQKGIEKNYIPKSKIQDKIKELEEESDYYTNRDSYAYEDGESDSERIDDLYAKISVLQSLLLEEN